MSTPAPRSTIRGGVRKHRPGDATTYALGEWSVLEALRHRPACVEAVALDPELAGARREGVLLAAAAAGVPAHDDARTVRSLRHRSDALAVALLRAEDDRLEPDRHHLVLAGTRNPGNLGSALRSALGFDVRDVALVASPLDAWSPHVLRASLGARFALRVARFDDWAAYRRRHPDQHAVAFAASRPDRPATPLPAWRWTSPSALAFGPEWAGDGASTVAEGPLPGDLPRVAIPQHADLESHNLAVAVGIALYALRYAP